MKKLFIFLFLMSIATSSYSGQQNKIYLNDGSVINGEVISFSNGVYTVNNATFGQIKIDALKIAKIESTSLPNQAISSTQNLTTNPKASVSVKSEIEKYKAAVSNNPEVAAMVTEIATDPYFQELLKDQSVIDAAGKGDLDALTKNEKFMKIANSPKMKGIAEKIKE